MKTNNPIRGLLHFYYYSHSGNIAIIMLMCLVGAAVLLITGNHRLMYGFNIIAIASLPFAFMMRMGGKEYPKWERFRITMPIRRSDLASAQFLSILLASLAGLPLAVLIKVLTFTIHEIDYNLVTALVNILSVLAMPLFMSGLLFTLGCSKIGENRGDAFFLICTVPAVGNTLLMPWIANRFELPVIAAPLMAIAVALAVFICSYFITRRIYAKMDF